MGDGSSSLLVITWQEENTFMKGLTPKQNAILQFIQEFIALHHYAPSYRDIMQKFALASPGSVYKYIKVLTRKGVLTTEARCSRSMQVLAAPVPVSDRLHLPLIGIISAGYPLEIFMQTQTLEVPSSFVPTPENTYILQVRGDGLRDEFMQDGDLLIVEARSDVEAGELILGLINQHDAIVRRYYPEGPHVRLESQNPQQSF